jgi:hypothetical protein
MTAFERTEEIRPASQFGNCGPDGWSFTLWGSPTCEERVHRRLIEGVAATHPQSELSLPEWFEGEDLIEGSMIWDGSPIWIWFETVLNHTVFWSADRDAITSLRAAAIPVANAL